MEKYTFNVAIRKNGGIGNQLLEINAEDTKEALGSLFEKLGDDISSAFSLSWIISPIEEKIAEEDTPEEQVPVDKDAD